MTPARDRTKRLAAWIVELALALGLVLTCFVLFLAVLGLSFPRGTNLQDLVGYAAEGSRGGNSGLTVDLGPATGHRTQLAASLARVFRRVTDRPPDAIAWTEARVGAALRDRHAVQTFSRSGATITFGADHGLQLSENSLIIIKRLERETATHTERAVLMLMEGELSTRVEARRGQRVAVEIATGQGRFDMAASGDRPADFKLTVAANRSSTLAVYAGQANVTAEGQTVVVPPDHAVTVLPGQAPGAPVRLAARPVATAPEPDTVHRFRTEAAEVRFDWDDQADAEQYRLVLARDPDCGDVVHRGALGTSGFTHGHLLAGTYYWKVSALRDGIEGPPTAGRRLTVVQDREPPALRVEAVPEVVAASAIVLRGATDPGSRVLIGEREAPTDSAGAFALDTPLDPGLNLIVIEALDLAGNASYRSLLLNAKFPEKTP